jgi:integrase
MKLTDKSVAALKLPAGKRDAIYFDDKVTGFGMRLRESCQAVYVFQYRVGRRQRRMPIGRVERLRVEEARKHARKLAARVELGEDPQAYKAREKIERAKADVTLGGVIESHLEAKAPDWRPKTMKEISYLLRTLWKPLHRVPAGEVSRADVNARVRKIATENGKTTARYARAALSACLAWAMKEGFPIEQNPVLYTNAPTKPDARDRVLSRDEIAALWNACRGDDFGRIVRLLLCTGCRRQEVGSMAHSEIVEGVWTIPASRSKNKQKHSIPLVGMAAEIVASVPKVEGRDVLFGTTANGFRGWHEARQTLQGRVGPMPQWQLHDIRRSVVTHMAEIGIEPHIVEAVVNHISGHKGGVAGIYNRATYAPRIRQALERWNAELQAIIGGERKIVPMLTPRTA